MIAQVEAIPLASPAARGARAVEDQAREAAGAVASALGGSSLVRLRQVHGSTVRVAFPAPGVQSGVRTEGEGDALVTWSAGVGLVVVTADCVPVVLADRSGAAVAVVHAGWRGVAAGVLGRTLETLRTRAGVEAPRLEAHLGPAAGGCCYEVGPEVVAALSERGGSTEPWLRPGKRDRPHVDLRAFVRDELVREGVPPEAVAEHGDCTICGQGWPSYRRQGKAAGRIWTAVALAR